MATNPKPIEAKEAQVPFQGLAILANRFYVTVGPTVRIAFAEQGGPDMEPKFRTAVAMAHSDAIELADVLKALLADIEKQLAAAQAKVAAKSNG